MASFSERYGFKPVRNVLQVNSMDIGLRNRLWNALTVCYWEPVNQYNYLSSSGNQRMNRLCHLLWHDYFKKPIDTLEDIWSSTRDEIRVYFFGCEWCEVYDFIQFISNNYEDIDLNNKFTNLCNQILKEELSGYRFVGDLIIRITSEEEIAEIEEALRVSDSLGPVTEHLKTAITLLSDRESPDYRNSIKESISAVEAICKLIAGKPKAELGDCLKQIEREQKVELHQALKQGFEKFYGYTSNAQGIRHALLEQPNLDFEDAKFMLVSCSAFINYLKVKSSKAGIAL